MECMRPVSEGKFDPNQSEHSPHQAPYRVGDEWSQYSGGPTRLREPDHRHGAVAEHMATPLLVISNDGHATLPLAVECEVAACRIGWRRLDMGRPRRRLRLWAELCLGTQHGVEHLVSKTSLRM